MILATAFYTTGGGVPAVGLVLADIDLYMTAQHKVTGALTVIWNGTQHPTVEVTNVGAYTRPYALEDTTTYNYVLRASYTGVAVLDVDHVTGAVELSQEEVSDEMFAVYPVEGAMTFEEYQRVMFAVLAALSGGGGTNILTFRDLANLKDRITAQVDNFGNRLNVVVDGTP